MADPMTQSKLQRLYLSAAELQSMTDWPNALIEDYLNILDDLITLSQEIDDLIDRTTGITRVDSDYTILADDSTIFADTDTGVINISFIAGVEGKAHRIVNVGSSGNQLNLIPYGTEKINGANETEVLYDSESLELQFDSTEGWF